MARSQNFFIKQENEKKRLKKRDDKLKKKELRSQSGSSDNFDSMIAYVDEYGNPTDTPPDPTKKIVVDASTIEIGVSRRTEPDVPAIRKGRVDYFDDSKGFGFIKEIGTQEKFFVHVKGLLQEVKEGDIVEFEIERGMKGLNAVRVKKVTA
jgi:cold shock CspA family protein